MSAPRQETRSYTLIAGSGIDELMIERLRQISIEGFDNMHDDTLVAGELVQGAAIYALHALAMGGRELPQQLADVLALASDLYPRSLAPFKPRDTRRDLVIAAALIFAELDRLDRIRTAAGVKAQPRLITEELGVRDGAIVDRRGRPITRQ